MIYDLIIIGAGPAGMTAGIYANRAMLNSVIIENDGFCGGQILTTSDIQNYPGFYLIDGFELAERIKEHGKKLGCKFTAGNVRRIEKQDKTFRLILEDGGYMESKAVIIATGARHRKLGVKGEEELAGKGVSYCAVCDGAFFRNKTVAVIGGGDTSLKDAIYLARVCAKVYIIIRRDVFRASKSLIYSVEHTDNIEIIQNTVVESINGADKVENLSLRNKIADGTSVLAVDGVFVAIGAEPVTEFVKGLIEINEKGYIVADETGVTSMDGIFAAGDIRTKSLRQIITAAADGANCANSAERYLEKLKG